MKLSRSLLLLGLAASVALAHEDTLPAALAYLAKEARDQVTVKPTATRTCTLALHLRAAASAEALAGLVRVTPLEGKGIPLFLDELFERPAGWFAMPADATLKLPAGRYRVEALHGTETVITTKQITLAGEAPFALTLELTRFYNPAARHLRNGNTHLHLLLNAQSKMSVQLHNRAEADAYLQAVGHSDGLDLVYVSDLSAPRGTYSPDQIYISNDYTAADLARFSQGPTLYGHGIEHRHGGARDGNDNPKITYGHVMLLDVAKGSIPMSIGPGLADDPNSTDGTPLREGMIHAGQQGAGIIWCHGAMGLEDIPDWLAGLIHAQNIYDGGNLGDFDSVFYPYLNIGLKVPFSTGTDWGIWDFSRVYVSSPGKFTSKVFLTELEAGRSYITNGPFLEFSADQSAAGDTITLAQTGPVHVRGRAIGRADFLRLQVVYNGKIIQESAAHAVDGHFEADLDFTVTADRSGWLALRIPPVKDYDIRSRYSGPGTNILGKAIFAHTSPIYLSVAGQPTFDAESAEYLRLQVQLARKTIDQLGKFANAEERAGLLNIYREAEAKLQHLLDTRGRP